jgi:GrpB-like predicted nucleotidyltransferase (UPF0157 family)
MQSKEIAKALAERVTLVPHDPGWILAGAHECRRIQAALGDRVREVRHIGSTAVPGLMSKPILDLIAGFPSLEQGIQEIGFLRSLGYHFPAALNAGLKDRQWLMRQSRGHSTHHLHIVAHDSEAWEKRTRFCELLKSSPALRSRYQSLKLELARLHGGKRSPYSESKAQFIRESLD